MDEFGRALMVEYVHRDPDTTRLISARQANGNSTDAEP